MKILLINPSKQHQVWAGVPDIFNSKDIYLFPPLGILYLASGVQAFAPGHEVRVLDCVADTYSYPQLQEHIRQLKPEVVGVMAVTHNLVDVKYTVQAARAALPQCHIIVGGPHCWVYPESVIAWDEVDAVLEGEGEHALGEWLNALEAGTGLDKVPGWRFKHKGEVVVNPKRESWHDLDALPFPARSLLRDKPYFTPAMRSRRATTLITSRGCPYRCVFCSTHKEFRSRSAANIVDELEACQQELGIEEVHFIDDTFNINSQRVIEVAQEILRRKLKLQWGFKGSCSSVTPEMLDIAREAGCTKIHYGVETHTPEGLKALNKRASMEQIKAAFALTRQAKIRAIAYLMLGCPHEHSREEVLGARSFIRELDPDYVVEAIFSPYPDAPIFAEGVKLGLWPADCWEKFMRDPTPDYQLPTVWNQYLSKEEILELLKELHRSFYFSPKVIWRTFSSIQTPTELKRIILGGLSLLRMEFLRPQARRI